MLKTHLNELKKVSKIFQKNDKYQVIKVDGGKDKRGKNYVIKIYYKIR